MDLEKPRAYSVIVYFSMRYEHPMSAISQGMGQALKQNIVKSSKGAHSPSYRMHNATVVCTLYLRWSYEHLVKLSKVVINEK